jgi:hypothetical protein
MGGVLNLFNSLFNRLGHVGAVACCRWHRRKYNDRGARRRASLESSS